MKEKYIIGLQNYRDALALVEKASEIRCPVCCSNSCYQWRGMAPPLIAGDCPLKDKPKVCEMMFTVSRDEFRTLKSTLRSIIYSLEKAHLNALANEVEQRAKTSNKNRNQS